MPRSNKKRSKVKPPSKSPPEMKSNSTANLYENNLFKYELNLMLGRAKSSAQKHGIKLTSGTPNPASGNCAFESVILM